MIAKRIRKSREIDRRIVFTAKSLRPQRGFFVGFVQILEKRFRLWTEPSPDGRLMNQIVNSAVTAISLLGVRLSELEAYGAEAAVIVLQKP